MEKFNKTLRDILITQDLGMVDHICETVLNDCFDSEHDPLTAVIVNAFKNNETCDMSDMVSDLQYAIDQLKRAIKFIES